MSNKIKIINDSLAKVMGECFGRYAKYIIQDRALPDVRDGLKPVQRRILYAMNELGLSSDKPYKKSARTVGEVIGKYHPHGDSSIYEAMVRMSQDWKNNLPLLDMHGNNGSIDGDSAAAMRYTECRLSSVADLMLSNIKSDTVKFILNFDDSEKEPTILPSLFPNLLINGAVGIAAGYATNIPTFNPIEVFDVCIRIIDNVNISTNEILSIMPGPDFPTGGIIEGIEGIKDFYQTGRGKFIISSKIELKTDSKNNQIIVTEIPYDTYKSQIINEINEIIFDEKISGILEVKDISNKNGICIVIDCKKDKNLTTIKNYLLKNTHLQINYSANFVAIVDRKPTLLNITDAFKNYIDYALDIQLKIAKFDLKKAENRFEIVNGLIIAINNIKDVIDIIRSSDSKENAKINLINKFHFTENQVESIVLLRLYRLSKTDITQFLDEANRLESIIRNLKLLISSEELQKIELKNKLLSFKKQYQIERKTKIVHEVKKIDINEIDTIDIQDIYLFVSRDGNLKTVSTKTFDTNDFADIGHKQYDFIFYSKKCKTNQFLLLVTKFGKVILLPIYKIKSNKWKDIGDNISSFTSFNSSDKIIYCEVINNINSNYSLLFLTKFGLIKRTNLNEIINSAQLKQSIGMKLKQDDELISSKLILNNENYFVTIINNLSRVYAFNILEVPILQRSALGVKTMKLKDDEFLVSSIISKDLNSDCCLILKNDFIKFSMNKINLANRVSTGKTLINKLESQLVNCLLVDDNSNICYMNNDSSINNVVLKNYKLTRELILLDIIDSNINYAYSDAFKNN